MAGTHTNYNYPTEWKTTANVTTVYVEISHQSLGGRTMMGHVQLHVLLHDCLVILFPRIETNTQKSRTKSNSTCLTRRGGTGSPFLGLFLSFSLLSLLSPSLAAHTIQKTGWRRRHQINGRLIPLPGTSDLWRSRFPGKICRRHRPLKHL